MTPAIMPVGGDLSGTMSTYGQTMPYDARLASLGSQMLTSPGFIDSVAMEVWRYLPETEQKKRMDAKQAALFYTPMLLQERYQFEQRHVGQFQALNEYHWQNMEYTLMSRQWSEEEKQVFADQGLLHYVNNTMRRYALTALGEKIGQRTDWRARARRAEHDGYADAANIAMRWAADRNNWKMQEQYCYRDGMVGSRGVAGVRRDYRNPYGNIILERYRPQEFMWDIMTARDPRLKGTKYLERIYFRSRADLMVEFPEWAEEIRAYSTPGMYTQHIQNLQVLIQAKTDPTIGSDMPAQIFEPTAYAGWADSLLCTEFYRRHPVLKYRVVDGYRRKVVDFETAEQATEWGRITYNYYLNFFQANGIPILEPAISPVQPVYVDAVERIMWAGMIPLRIEPFGQDEFPYHFFIPEWIDNNVTSFFGHGKDHQRIINRMFTRMDQAAGGVKGKTVINKWALQSEYSDEELDAILASDTAPLKVNIPPGMSMDEVIKITGIPSIGELPSMLMKVAFEGQEQMYGGLNAIGDQQSSAESGVAVRSRQTASALALIPYMEEFASFKRGIGKHLLQNIQQLDPTTLMSIMDETPRAGQANASKAKMLLAFGEQSIGEIDMDLDVIEVQASPSDRDRRASTMKELFGQIPALVPYALNLYLKDVDVDEDEREIIVSGMQSDMDMKNQLAMQQQAHTQAMETQEMELRRVDKMIKLEELKIKSAPPPQWTVNVKAEDTPELQASLANRIGMDADPLGVAQAKAAEAYIKQAALDLQQQSYYKNMPEWARTSVKAPGGPETPKDASNRSTRNESS